jgi:hypothetical protein
MLSLALLFFNELDIDPALPGPVQLNEEDLLPGSEDQSFVFYRNYCTVSEEHRLKMGMSIAIVPVVEVTDTLRDQ